MPLVPGMRLGVYEIQSALGAGGMGDVYRARDTELDRDVAIKVLPAALAFDPDRVARFKREAQLLASLNHPNIAAIYGLEQADGVQALVLELVDGSTLAEILQRRAGSSGPAGIPLDEALPIARQIVDALEAAHEQGVVHRDLKPANIKLRPDGTVKVLDFGLAKALDPVSAAGESQSPTMTSPAMTRLGMILGTAAYMAPEQARGRAVDRRADIWAFGCVLFEMLTGGRAFAGDDVAETFGAVIHKEPAWSALPANTPAYLRRLLGRCLQKNPKKRLPHIGVARLEIDEPSGESAASTAPAGMASRSRGWTSARVAWSVAAAAVIAAVALNIMSYLARRPADAPVMRTSILPPSGVSWAPVVPSNRFLPSPDGPKLAFIGVDAGGVARLWIRPLDALMAQPLAGTDGVTMAAWSPDSRFLAFAAVGGFERSIYPAGLQEPHSWSPDGRLIAYHTLIASSGGMAQNLWTLPVSGGDKPSVFMETPFGELHPRFSPDGRWLAYASNESGRREIYVVSFPDRGDWPRWRRDGRELIYLAPDNMLTAVPLNAGGPALQVGEVKALFALNPRLTTFAGYYGYPYDISADAQRILVNMFLEADSGEPPTLLVNWPALLRQ
jgi:hypothetical protein